MMSHTYVEKSNESNTVFLVIVRITTYLDGV